MRTTASAALAALALAGGVLAAAGAAQSQPYGYYPGPDNRYGYTYSPPQAYDPYGRYVPNGGYYNGYVQPQQGSLGAIAGAVLGAVIGQQGYGYDQGYGGYGYGVPVDQYGPDPNGMIGPDGRRIKCKLRRTYDSYYRGYVTRRECWPN